MRRELCQLYDRSKQALKNPGVKSRFLLVGGLNTAIGLSIFPVLIWATKPLEVSYLTCLTISHILGVLFAYTTRKSITFRTKRNYLHEISRFSAFYFLNYIANIGLLAVAVEEFHRPVIASQLVFALAGTGVSYFWHSRITFRTKGATIGGD